MKEKFVYAGMSLTVRDEVCTACKADKNLTEGLEHKEFNMSQWECTVCGYVYDPEAGDPEHGFAPGTPFEDLPESWFCPNCGVGKEFFEKVE